MASEATALSSESTLTGQVLAGRYRIERLLGSGGMGSVYLAEHVLMHKTVAVKVLHHEMTRLQEIVARFEREAVAAARIDHPNVAAASDCGKLEDGSLYLVLEYVDGTSLRSIVEKGPLPVERALAIARQIADALVAAHAVGIVHRDLKPENVLLVAAPDRQDHVKVLDFGIAKVLEMGGEDDSDRKLTRIGAVMGTAGYMPPEQALGQRVDHRADLYSFGVVLYEMLSGKLPFWADDFSQVLAKQLTEAPAPLPEGVPKALSDLVSTLLRTAAEDRLGSAQELRERLSDLERTSAPASAPADVAFAAETQDTEPAPPRRSARKVVAIVGVGIGLAAAFAAWKGGLLGGVGPASAAPPNANVVLAARDDTAAPSAGHVAAPSASTVAAPNATEATAASTAASGSATDDASSPNADSDKGIAAASVGGSRAPKSSASNSKSFSETRSTKRDGRTARTSRRTTSEERTTKVTKHRTGPGGIYIPPPSQWFK